MPKLFDLANMNGFAAFDLEDRHLDEWGVAVTDPESQKWLDLHAVTPDWLAELRRTRSATFADAIAANSPQRFEFVVEDASGAVAACVQLAGDICPADPKSFGVEIGYVVHPNFRLRGVATGMLGALPSWVHSQLGDAHTFGSVCTSNVGSTAAMHSAGIRHIRDKQPCFGSADQRRHQCADKEAVFCSGHP
jgi:RimJ/RimL family protein N-acetyltransferase